MAVRGLRGAVRTPAPSDSLDHPRLQAVGGRAGCTAAARLWECGWEAGPVRRAEAACEVVAGAGLAASDSGEVVAALRDVEERRRLRRGSVEPAAHQSD